MSLNIRAVGTNMTELSLGDKDATVIFFSYSTPVAYTKVRTGESFKTSKKFSQTTTKHINKFLAGYPAEEVSQEHIEGLLA